VKKLLEKELIDRFNIIHNYKFDYSLMIYKNNFTKIKIICPVHGIFEQTPKNHLKGNDCFDCSKKKKSKTTEKFINQSNIVHNYFYDYSLTQYKNNTIKIKIICPIHGIFEQLPTSHISGSGCKLCGIEKTKSYTLLGLENFKKISNNIHDNKYNYDKVVYINSYTKVEIICPSHGSFFQKPNDHISSKCGCPICTESKGEKKIRYYLKLNNINYIQQKTFKKCKNKNELPFDFYLPDLNICIEYDGEQHFRSVVGWGDEESFKNLQLRDNIKNEYCKNNNIELLRISYLNKNIEKTINDFLLINKNIVI